MGIPLDIFSLYQLWNEGDNCHHYLLLKVEQGAFNNADEGEYDHVVKVADQKKNALIEFYKAAILVNECAGTHGLRLVGELQSAPVGNELFEEFGGFSVNLWIAETRFGHPWVVLGTAENEAAFWQAIERDADLSNLGATKPAQQQRAFFLTERWNEPCRDE